MKDPGINDQYSAIMGNDISVKFKNEIEDETKIDLIEVHFSEIMKILGLDLKDDSLKNTPRRVAKMYVKEIFSGLNPDNKPSISLFPNKYNYNNMLVEKDITLYSTCEHHFVPITGKVHIGYYPGEQVIGLSKLNRIVQYYARRPQQQENLTVQIAEELKNILGTDDIAVLIEADHLCVKARGVHDVNSRTVTSSYNGRFLDEDNRKEFLNYL